MVSSLFPVGVRCLRRMYLGHGSEDATEKYARHEVTQYLSDDAAKMHTYIQKSIEEVKDKTDDGRSESISSGVLEQKCLNQAQRV